VIKNICFVILTFIFVGCFSITKEVSSFNTYSLSLDSSAKEASIISSSIEVKEPKAINSLNSLNIIFTNKDSSFEHYALNKWSDRPSKMLHLLMLEKLSSSFSLIKTPYMHAKTVYVLETLLLDFKHDLTKKKTFLKINTYLYNKKTKESSFKQFSYEKDLSVINAKNAVSALNILSNQFIRDLNKWSKEKIKN